MSPGSEICSPPANFSSSTHNPTSLSSTSTLTPRQTSVASDESSQLPSELGLSSTHHGVVSCGASLASEVQSIAASERTRDLSTTPTEGARDFLGELPTEIRDAIFGQYTTHALAVKIYSQESHRGWARRLGSTYVAVPNGALLTIDGTIASKARQTSSYLRRGYQASNRHLVRREGVQKALLVTPSSSGLIKWFLSRLDKDDPPVIFVLTSYLESVLDPDDLFEGCLRNIVKEVGSYYGDIEIHFVYCDQFIRLGKTRLQYPPGRGLPDSSTATAHIKIRRFVVQRLKIHSVDTTSITTTTTTYPAFARVLELIPEALSIVRCCVRHTLPQVVCAILGRHTTGAEAVDRIRLHNWENPEISPEEAQALENLLSPPREVLRLDSAQGLPEYVDPVSRIVLHVIGAAKSLLGAAAKVWKA